MTKQPPDRETVTRMTQWLGGREIPVRLGFSSSGIRVAVSEVPEEAGHATTVEVTDGQLVLHLDLIAIERLLLQIANEATQAHHATVDEVKLRLSGSDDRALNVAATIKARRSLFSTALELTGQLRMDENLHARLTNLDLRGQGVLGKMVASLVRPQLERLADQPIVLTHFAPGQLELQDVRLHANEPWGMSVTLGPSRVILGSRSGSSRPSTSASRKAGTGVPSQPARKMLADRRLDIFVIDTGWNSRARQLLDDHLHMFAALLTGPNVYHLSPDQSTQVLQPFPALAGSDPILMVLDKDAYRARPQLGYGFRLCLGAIAPDAQCGEELDRILRFLVETGRGTAGRMRPGHHEPQHPGRDERIRILVDIVGGDTGRDRRLS